MKDPFTIVYDAIIKELSSSNSFRVVNWNSTRDPEKQTVSEADLPEVQLMPTERETLLGSASCGTFITQTYAVIVNTGDNRLGVLFFPVEWALTEIMHRLQYGFTLDALSFDGHRFVIDTLVTSNVSGLSNQSNNRGINGWTALWNITVRMSFKFGVA